MSKWHDHVELIKNLGIALFFFTFISFAQATDVVIETDFQSGRGILREVGGNCFVYTPKHVVENADGIYVSSPHERDVNGSFLTSYPQDLALILLPSDYTKMCRDSSWKDGGKRVNTLLSASQEATLSFRKKSGSLTEFDLRIVNKDLHTYFDVALSDSSKEIIQGMSGSIVYIGSYPLGMLVSVSDGVGRVLRMDSISDITKSVMDGYSSEIEKHIEASGDPNAFSEEKRKISKNKIQMKNNDTNTFEGEITEGQEKSIPIIVTGNTAFRLRSKKQNQGLRVEVEFIAPNGKVIKDDTLYTGDKDYSLGYGAASEGEYTLRITGVTGDYGTYDFQWETIATPEQLLGEVNILGHGDTVNGFLSEDTYAEYTVVATGNTAFRLKSKKQNQGLRVEVEFIAPNGKVIKDDTLYTGDKDYSLGYGSVSEGEYTLRITGVTGDYGTYNFQWEIIATPEQLLGEANVLGHGDVVNGFVSEDTYAEYAVIVKGNTAFRLKSKKQSQGLRVGVEFIAPNGKVIKDDTLYTGDKDYSLGYGAASEGEYTLRITGVTGDYGTYNFQWETIATPEQLLGEANVLGRGDTVKGFLSEDTYAEYKIEVAGNSAFRLLSKKQNLGIRVEVEFIAPDGSIIEDDTVYTGRKDYTLSYTAPMTGTYTLRITGVTGDYGAYKFSIDS
ncbi:hypothetical protein [Gilvimarinus algae]|uniref:Peptidase C-terminal archaeal/bacterial domain-containing protein n=1 Tax=Gilvimarinus algae TaxID=3058037 RepID=A0ABT8TC48_9GAMM|nr:hypothetical protein [Gilvimarinus sp. SDUM040014]MDO3381588.1 hypothetical protein [Gilvimarinus sp. SDUM040014]